MTGQKKQARLQKLKETLAVLESKLYDAQCEENAKINRMGWGHGMRCVKTSISTRKSDRLKERIEKCKSQIAELK